jgi:hypothetical protein
VTTRFSTSFSVSSDDCRCAVSNEPVITAMVVLLEPIEPERGTDFNGGGLTADTTAEVR